MNVVYMFILIISAKVYTRIYLNCMYTSSVYLKGNTLGLDLTANPLVLLLTSSLFTVRIVNNTSLCGVYTLCVRACVSKVVVAAANYP